MQNCFIALGSNLNNPVLQIQTAIEALKQLPQTQFVNSSSLYRSKPLGPQDQADFINAVIQLTTDLNPFELLKALQNIETVHGRERLMHWGPRTLDLDLLLYGNVVIDSAELIIPHPGLTSRQFVLQPLAEIAPGLILPSGKAIASLVDDNDNNVIKL